MRADGAAGAAARPQRGLKSGPEVDPEISSIHYRAQEVRPGGLFVAIAGLKADGHDYIDEALRRGAAAVVAERPVRCDAVVIHAQNSRKALAEIAGRFYGQPSHALCLIGITGTNGKTTTAYLIESILNAAGIATGVIGTINYRYAGLQFDNPVTTPESLDLQRILAEMRDRGVSHVVLEVSSHAVDLHRIHGCEFDIGVFTNITQDHLDYHGDMQRYWQCKKRFFSEYLGRGPKHAKAAAVVCTDHRAGRELLEIPAIRAIAVGHDKTCAVRPSQVRADLSGLAAEISLPAGAVRIRSALAGAHNLENILCAAGVGSVLGIDAEKIRLGIERLRRVPGRLERVDAGSDRFVYVDYAHTPDALENVLTALRTISQNRIVCIFGCGGDRDRGKRPLMGEIAGRLCDLAIITSDNPRSEDPLAIIAQIENGIRRTSSAELSAAEIRTGPGPIRKGYVAEPDRRKAIRLAVSISRPGDIILIAGKGHETYQIVGSRKHPFDDCVEARWALADSVESSLKTTGGQGGP